MNQDFVLELFFSLNGDVDKINQVIDSKLQKNQIRKITTFEMYIKSRLASDSRALRMANMGINPVETAYLSMYPDLAGLEILDLRQNLLGDEGLQAIVNSPVLTQLRELDLRNNQISRLGMELLAKAPNMAQLEKLDLRANKLGKRWEEKIREQGAFPNLKEIKTV